MPGEDRKDGIDRSREGRREPPAVDDRVDEARGRRESPTDRRRPRTRPRCAAARDRAARRPSPGSRSARRAGPRRDRPPAGPRSGRATRGRRWPRHRGPRRPSPGTRAASAGRAHSSVRRGSTGPGSARRRAAGRPSVDFPTTGRASADRGRSAGAPAIESTRASSRPPRSRPIDTTSCREVIRSGSRSSPGTYPMRRRTSHAITTRPPSEHLDGPARRPDEIEQTPDGRALAGAVGTDEAEDLAGSDLEVDALARPRPSRSA